MAEGNFEKASELNDQMADLAARKLEIEKGKAALEARGGSAPPPQRTATPSDEQKLQAYMQGKTPEAQAWLRAHPEYVLDERLNTRLLAKHYAALDEGHAMGSTDYFRSIEIGLGITGQTRANGAAAPAADPTAQAARSVQRRDDVQPSPAPASRGGSPRRITLTKAQQEAAEISGLSHEDYARSLDAERKKGTLIYTDNRPKH